MRIVLVGAGGLATNLGLALHEAGHDVLAVFSRTMEHARILAERIGITSPVEESMTRNVQLMRVPNVPTSVTRRYFTPSIMPNFAFWFVFMLSRSELVVRPISVIICCKEERVITVYFSDWMDDSSMLHSMPTSSAFKAPLLIGSATPSLSAPNTITGNAIATIKMLRICFFIIVSSIQMV